MAPRKHRLPPGLATTVGNPNTIHGAAPLQPTALIIVGQLLQFIGSAVKDGAFTEYSFEVIAGLTAPTVTGGYAKWSVIDRPQQVGLTVFQGYDPITMDVPILFDNMLASGVSPYVNTVEPRIHTLEWMAGRAGEHAAGVSPIVYINSANGAGADTGLVPILGRNIAWVITGVNWDPSPDRDNNGMRIRQACTVSVTQHIGPPGDADNAPARAAARKKLADNFVNVPITKAVNTIQKVAGLVVRNPGAAAQILKDNKARLKLPASVNADLYLHHKGQKLKVRESLYLG